MRTNGGGGETRGGSNPAFGTMAILKGISAFCRSPFFDVSSPWVPNGSRGPFPRERIVFVSLRFSRCRGILERNSRCGDLYWENANLFPPIRNYLSSSVCFLSRSRFPSGFTITMTEPSIRIARRAPSFIMHNPLPYSTRMPDRLKLRVRSLSFPRIKMVLFLCILSSRLHVLPLI
jgi:hypothetical protein